MNIIQQARDVLAKWQTHPFVRDDWFERAAATKEWGVLTPLIVGTAGNPDLLDAIDALLQIAQREAEFFGGVYSTFGHQAERIAAAIIAADERMSA